MSITPDQIPAEAILQLDSVVLGHAPGGNIEDATARQVIADLVNKTLTATTWQNIEPNDRTMTQCPDCAALVLKTGLPRHQTWHDQQTDYWREQWTGEQR